MVSILIDGVNEFDFCFVVVFDIGAFLLFNCVVAFWGFVLTIADALAAATEAATFVAAFDSGA